MKKSELEQKYKELEDKYVRLYAEMENFKKRIERDKSELTYNIMFGFLSLILPVVDDLERALYYNVDITHEGLSLIQKKFSNILSGIGLKEIEAKNQEFNTDLHEAITSLTVENTELKNKVVDEIQKGYIYNGKVIRHSKVIVGI